jgi:uncharacterized membrane protein
MNNVSSFSQILALSYCILSHTLYFFSFRWEYVWCVSVILSFVGLSAARSNKILNMQKYMIGVIVFGFFPIFYCFIYYLSDVIEYLQLDEDTDLEDTEIKIWQVVVSINEYFHIFFCKKKTF